MSIETIIAPVDKSDSSFDLQADNIFGGNGGAKLKKINSLTVSKVSKVNENYEKIFPLCRFRLIYSESKKKMKSFSKKSIVGRRLLNVDPATHVINAHTI